MNEKELNELWDKIEALLKEEDPDFGPFFRFELEEIQNCINEKISNLND